MKLKKLPKLNFSLVFSEKINTPKKEVVLRTQEEIDAYKKNDWQSG